MSKFRDYDNYEIYADGRIYSYKSKKFLKPQTMKNGYQQVWLSSNEGKMKRYLLHRVVYEAVSGSPIPEGMQINHRNEIKTDNRFFENLELVTPKQNINYGSRNERAGKAISKALKGIIPKSNPPKQVGAFKNDELVLSFTSTMEAERLGFNHSHISNCCNGKRKNHKGFEWKYI